MTFAEEMAELAVELLDPAEFGEEIVIRRPASIYDPTTRKTTAQTPLLQTVHGTTDTELSSTSAPASLVAKYAAVLTAAPLSTGGFKPGQNDRVETADGTVFQVEETAHVIKQGTPILWICGLSST